MSRNTYNKNTKTDIKNSTSLNIPSHVSEFADRPWNEYSFVAFDTETSGAYPIGDDIVEFGAVKWKDGKEVDSIQFLLKPRNKMTDYIINIHGITNEMVANAPEMKDKIQEIRNFFEGSVLMAHHAPFDLGFVAADLEKYALPFPQQPIVCTSLLSRVIITDTINHKLQTLVKYFKIDGGNAHRALDDARSCLTVGLECMKRVGDAKLSRILQLQGKHLSWENYSVRGIRSGCIPNIIQAIETHKILEIIYEGGTHRGKKRSVKPIGLVRNPDGDYLKAVCMLDGAEKRFYLSKISDSAVTFLDANV